jgi:hypothetical protein
MNSLIAFADEFGNNSFDFKEQGSHFIIASVIIKSEKIKEISRSLDLIRFKYFQKGEIKSSKIGQNHKRRKIILKEICKLDFTIYAVIVDKTKLYAEGFKYKQPFYKFLNGILYKELFKTFPELELKIDEHGGNDYLVGFKKYVEKNHIRDLFSGSNLIIKNSNHELGIQLADLVAGTLGYIFDKNKKSIESQYFYELIKPKISSLNHFPKKNNLKNHEVTDTENNFDLIVASLSLRKIFDFIDTTNINTEEKRDQISFLKLLLLYNQSNFKNTYTTSNEFIKHLNINRPSILSKEQFAKIIANLRDKGVLIATSRDGYKIPTTILDLKKYIKHGNNIVFPIINRIQECRNSILLATQNSCDILDINEFRKLKKIIDVQNKDQII